MDLLDGIIIGVFLIAPADCFVLYTFVTVFEFELTDRYSIEVSRKMLEEIRLPEGYTLITDYYHNMVFGLKRAQYIEILLAVVSVLVFYFISPSIVEFLAIIQGLVSAASSLAVVEVERRYYPKNQF